MLQLSGEGGYRLRRDNWRTNGNDLELKRGCGVAAVLETAGTMAGHLDSRASFLSLSLAGESSEVF